MLEYVTDELISAAKRRARLPDAALPVADLLGIANEELETYIAPLIISAQGDYYETDLDYPLQADPGATYRVPPRAVGGSLRAVSFLDSSGKVQDVPQVSIADLEQASYGVTLKAQALQCIGATGLGLATLRLTYALTPGRLVQAASAATVNAIVGQAITLSPLDAPVHPLPDPVQSAPLAFAGEVSFDFVKGSPGFELVAFDQAGTCDGTTLTLTGAVPSGLAVGDYVTLPFYSVVPQCPTNLWAVLAQAVAVGALRALGQDAEADAKEKERDAMAGRVLPTLRNRIKANPKSIIPRHGIFQAVRRW